MGLPRLTLACLLSTFAAPLEAQERQVDPIALQKRVLETYKEHHKAVVTVHAAQQLKGKSSLLIGTGFYISREGHLLTNAVTVYGAERVWVSQQGINYAAEVIGTDITTNLAIIKVQILPSSLHYLRFSDKVEMTPPGTFIIAISSKLGMVPGPSFGIIEGWNTEYGQRALPTLHLRANLEQSGGEGGAPIFDLNGSLVGVVALSLPKMKASLILPAKAVKRVRDALLFSGKISFAFFGLNTQENISLERKRQVVVKSVEKGSPAHLAGVLKGDILLKLGDRHIEKDADLRDAIFYAVANEIVSLLLRRNSKNLRLEIKPSPIIQAPVKPLLIQQSTKPFSPKKEKKTRPENP